ncbi:hypothetical protein AK830_g5222 [Neonectria ditissima]|uniref:Uncharacterized protein n=1 Tax=Neonectria ditissima TaxID=78410 RepID=A0A0P7B5M2_9HYPO|nr:hypothetical protein AK830_g5222 [Neonectria ditissima]
MHREPIGIAASEGCRRLIDNGILGHGLHSIIGQDFGNLGVGAGTNVIIGLLVVNWDVEAKSKFIANLVVMSSDTEVLSLTITRLDVDRSIVLNLIVAPGGVGNGNPGR